MRHESRFAGRRPQPGFTLVEVLVAAVIFAALLGVLWGLVRMATLMTSRSQERLDPREQALFAMTWLRRSLADAHRIKLEDDSIQFTTPRGNGRILHEAATGRLLLTAPGASTPRVLTRLAVDTFEASFTGPGLVEIRLGLARSLATGKLASLGPFIVVEDILMPVPGSRADGIPWRPVLAGEPDDTGTSNGP